MSPWEISDVEKHRKGLSESGKKKWCRVANGILSKCQRKSGKDCDSMAVKIANSVFESKRKT